MSTVLSSGPAGGNVACGVRAISAGSVRATAATGAVVEAVGPYGSGAISGFTVTAKVWISKSPERPPMASVSGIRARCSSIDRVKSFGTSR